MTARYPLTRKARFVTFQVRQGVQLRLAIANLVPSTIFRSLSHTGSQFAVEWAFPPVRDNCICRFPMVLINPSSTLIPISYEVALNKAVVM